MIAIPVGAVLLIFSASSAQPPLEVYLSSIEACRGAQVNLAAEPRPRLTACIADYQMVPEEEKWP